MVTGSKLNFRDLTELIVECYTKFAKMLYWSALQITFLAGSERVKHHLMYQRIYMTLIQTFKHHSMYQCIYMTLYTDL